MEAGVFEFYGTYEDITLKKRYRENKRNPLSLSPVSGQYDKNDWRLELDKRVMEKFWLILLATFP